jgi:prohibitin 2
MNYDERVLPSIANEVLASTVAQFTASQLITKREEVSDIIKKKLTERARDFHLILDDVSITHLTFANEYMQAVEAKQVAQQEAERARFVVERARQDKEETIVRAEGEADAARQFNEQLSTDKSGNFLSLRRIEAAKEIAHTIASGGNRVYLNADTLLFNCLIPNADVPAHRVQEQ